MAINVSGHQFKHRDLCKQVLGQLSLRNLDIDAVDIEITETVAMERTDQVTSNVERLVAAGISISMDDFGTGYSSLSNLQEFPVRRLKVDASFVRGIGTDRDDERIVEAVISLGHSLGHSVIAEGVKTQDQMSFLKALHCNEIQGYLVSKPLPAPYFEAFLKEHSENPIF
jgi:EAL domain-containing protein (putative c-di-GMP-specific phosphodiesterase class I)